MPKKSDPLEGISHLGLRAVLERALELGLGMRRVTKAFGLVELSLGGHRERLLYVKNDLNGHVSVRLAKNKHMTTILLGEAGIPVPRGDKASSLESARRVAERIGYPVVLKPLRGSKGDGVSVNVTPETFDAAVTAAQRWADEIIVEKVVRGEDHRILVLDGRILAITKRLAPFVIGDGSTTLADLVTAFEQRRNEAMGVFAKTQQLCRDAQFGETLAEQQLSLEDIPEHGRRVALRRNANVSTGGVAVNLPGLPPELEAHAVNAAAALGLRFAGVDMLIDEDGSGVIIEVNETPGVTLHLAPVEGPVPDTITPVLRALFPELPA